MLRDLPTNVKLGVAALIVIILALLGYGIYKQAMMAGGIAVTVSVAPNDAKISVDGKTVGPGTIYLKPGKKYTVKASKDGFLAYNGSQYIDSSSSNITVALQPATDEAQKWVNDNQQQYTDVEAQAGARENAAGQEFSDKNPITDDLPIDNLIYTIGYKNDNSDPSGNSIILTIDAAQGYRNGAVQAIRDLGYDPSKFKIEFYNYTNPFAS
jgi:hypothetical protein